jgi:hypothetical protein
MAQLWGDWFDQAGAPTSWAESMKPFIFPRVHALEFGRDDGRFGAGNVSLCRFALDSNPWMAEGVNYAWQVNNRWSGGHSVEEFFARMMGEYSSLAGMDTFMRDWLNRPAAERARLQALFKEIMRHANFYHRTGPTGPTGPFI